MQVIITCTCFFSEVPRIEEVQDPDSSPRREEVGRRTLGDYGGFLLPFFYRDRLLVFVLIVLAKLPAFLLILLVNLLMFYLTSEQYTWHRPTR